METLEEIELCFPQLLNTSCMKPTQPHFETMLIYILLSSIALITAALNLLVIISISHFKQLHTPTNLLLVSLAVSDLFVGLLMVFPVMFMGGCWFLGDLMCTLYQYLAYIVASASVGTMVMISIDRYVAICHPLHYPTKITQKRVEVCVCLCWICSVIFQSFILSDILKQPGRYNSCVGECILFINYIAGLVDLTFSFIVPITVIVVLYMRVFVVAVSQARTMRSHVATITIQQSVKVTAKKSEMKAARTLGVVVVVFLICLCPYYCVALTGQDNLLNASSATFVICLYYFNSCLNPVIYAYFYPWFRKSVKLIVTLQILQPDSCDANIHPTVIHPSGPNISIRRETPLLDAWQESSQTLVSGESSVPRKSSTSVLESNVSSQPVLPSVPELKLSSPVEVLLPRPSANVYPACALAEAMSVPESASGSPASVSAAQQTPSDPAFIPSLYDGPSFAASPQRGSAFCVHPSPQ
ncbi:trace amine-associated receptor 13c-like [Symphorus nematophorus]